ncbi:unnamed protein product [Leuciscus chuanchicus]
MSSLVVVQSVPPRLLMDVLEGSAVTDGWGTVASLSRQAESVHLAPGVERVLSQCSTGSYHVMFQNLKIKFVETPEDPVGWLAIDGFTLLKD